MSLDHVDLVASPSETVGPFFHFGIATDAALGRLATPGAKGELITLRFVVMDGDGVPVPDALIEIWQVDADGVAPVPPAAGETTHFWGFGRLPTGDDGACEFQTVRPGSVSDGKGGRQAPHISVCVFARGLLRHLFTRVYFEGDPALAADPVLALVPEDRRPTLLARPAAQNSAQWVFSLRLQGEAETVFFDV
jgi:protocatechuate 3,4-dioxygenase alpha subunit